MQLANFTKILFNTINRGWIVFGVMIYLSTAAMAGKQKEFDKLNHPSKLILTLPDQLLITNKVRTLSQQSYVVTNNTVAQASSIKKLPIDVKCDVDVIQNTLIDMPLSSRIFGECGFDYHY